MRFHSTTSTCEKLCSSSAEKQPCLDQQSRRSTCQKCSKMGCGSSKMQVAPQSVTEKWASAEECTKRRPVSRESVRGRSTNKVTSPTDTKSQQTAQETKKQDEVSISSKTGDHNINVVAVQVVREITKCSSPSPLSSTHGSSTSVSRDSSAVSKASSMSNDSGLGREDDANTTSEKPDTKSEDMSSNTPNVAQYPTGIAFKVEVGTQSDNAVIGKPPAVRRLERRHRQRKQTTKEELEEKQAVAAKRRKELEQKLLERLKAQQEREREIKESLAKFIAMTAEKTKKEMEISSENREVHLKALRDRLKEKSKHMEEMKAAKSSRKLLPQGSEQQDLAHNDMPVAN